MNRREFFSLAASGAVAAPTISISSAIADDLCRFYAERLEEELQKRHGGEWLLEVDHEKMTVFGRRMATLPSS
jgi:glutamine synthetase type III